MYYRQGAANPAKTRSGVSFWRKLPVTIAALAIISSMLSTIFLTTNPKVIIINDDDKAVEPLLRDKSEYTRIVANELKSSLFNRSKVTIDINKTTDHLNESIPESTSTSLTLPILGRNPIVYIKIGRPEFIFNDTAGTKFVVDTRGRAVLSASEIQGLEEHFIPVNDKSGILLEKGSPVLSQDQMKFMLEVKTYLQANGIKIDKIELPEVANQMNVYPKGEKYYIKLSFVESAQEQVGKYRAITKQLKKEKSKANSYIDVRVDGRAYVR